MKNFTIILLINFLVLVTHLSKAQSTTLQTVTQNGNTTTKAIQITGSVGGIIGGKGLELYASSTNSGDGFIKAYDRVAGQPKDLRIQDGGPNGNTIINENGGYVGIGTTSPDKNLHIYGGNNSTYLKVSRDVGNITLGAALNYNAIYSRNNSDAAKDLQLIMGSTTAATILANGNVLIAKTSQTNSTYKLDVNGSIRANKIVVNTTGADFVFEPDYKLPSLKLVETYIKQNKHLPGIASANQMQNNGEDVGEMNTKLLQKVEELTLYVIELKKEIEELKSEKK